MMKTISVTHIIHVRSLQIAVREQHTHKRITEGRRKVDKVEDAPAVESPAKKIKIADETPLLDRLAVPKTVLETQSAIEQHMRKMADFLFNNVALYINGGTIRCRLAEIEFYLTTKDNSHKDPFSHCHPLQLRQGQWYFHQSTDKINDQNYREQSYKGLDITFGSEEDGYYGGVLIRSLEELNLKNDTRKSFTDGPSLCVDFILKKTNAATVHELVHKFPTDTLSVESPQENPDKYPIYLAPCKFEKKVPIYKSSRVGLTLRNITEQEARVRYIMKSYRFLTTPSQTKKGKNQVVATMYLQELNKLKKENGNDYLPSTRDKGAIIATMGDKLVCQVKTVTKWVELVDEGMKSCVNVDGEKIKLDNVRDYFRRDLTPEDVVKMHGVLHKLI